MTQPVMQLKEVQKTIKGKPIIKGLDFDIYPGEVFGFLGPNGAGKTTTIRMMVGLMKLTSGDIYIKGNSIIKDYKQAIRHVGGIVENPEMYPFMSGWKNLIHYSRMIPGIPNERIKEVVQLVGLENRVNDKVGKYSLGMRQRLGIAQALLHNPSILILDEPTNGLDPAGIREIRSYIRRMAAEENVAVIVSSHILSEMEMMCDRIGIIKNGELITIQSVQEALKQTEQREVSMEANPQQLATEIVTELVGDDISQSGEMIHFVASRAQIPDIIKHLVNGGVDLYSVDVKRSTLEDAFMDVIGGDSIE
ncbi:ABC transporter ATP-binding protein [Halobacillus locisalis]|uniref:ABC transporter ATP-binding protein n=1 Tax=Halobacillus locisalis TaxID=220753 RepID=A0A838CXV9_9BACI|nr:ABC transporter ATP-binding protein [Halobacillus locisalis]MBA2176669.1 ABC transporter ATP-binding protein [Halobacillus locisalis]